MCDDPSEYDVRPPLWAEQRIALDHALCQVPERRRGEYIETLLRIVDDQSVLPGLLVAKRDGQLCGAILLQLQPGRVATVWPPAAPEAEAERCIDALLGAAVRWLTEQPVRVAQAIVPLEAREQAARFARHGFAPLAELLSMISLSSQAPRSAPRLSLRLEPAFGHITAERSTARADNVESGRSAAVSSVNATDEGRLAAIVERTYEGTLDCPALNGVRDLPDVLASYRACGEFDPARWFIACRGERDVGCLLLADHPDADQWEIVYVGLVPEERGRGSGLALTRHAQWLARQAGRARLVLAVDAANAPAVAAYRSAGFIDYESRRALIRTFPDRRSQ